MRLVHVRIGVTGNVTVTSCDVDHFTVDGILLHLGCSTKSMGLMDSVHEFEVSGTKSIVVEFAQEKPWTYIKHVFALGELT